MTEPLQLYELAMLGLIVVGLVPVTLQYRKYDCRWLYAAYLLFFVAALFTNLEAVAAPTVLNALEHTTMVAASVLFWMTAYRSAEDVVDADFGDVLAELREEVTGQ